MSDAAFYAIPDQIDLRRLVRRLDISCIEDQWNEKPHISKWIKAQTTLQLVAHARQLLNNVEELDSERVSPRAEQLVEITHKLDEIEAYINDVKERPTANNPQTHITTLHPLPNSQATPSIRSPLTLDLPPNGDHVNAPSNINTNSPATEPTTDELLLPADTASFPTSNSFAFPTPMPLIPPSIPTPTTATTTATATGVSARFTQNTNTLHQDLSSQLALMATQLRKNAQHFSEALVKDKAVVEDTQIKVESNFDTMHKERTRLRDHSGKSSSTTWITWGVILAVVGLFMVMVLIIRATRF